MDDSGKAQVEIRVMERRKIKGALKGLVNWNNLTIEFV